jgi:hypothetical protein
VASDVTQASGVSTDDRYPSETQLPVEYEKGSELKLFLVFVGLRLLFCI